MSKIALADVVANLRDLPSLPLIITELIASFEQDDVSIGQLASKVAQDQALAAKTLRLANSSFYGMSSKVKTIDQAISVLGFDSVRALVSATGIIDNFRGEPRGGFNFVAFWRHAVATALCAKSLAGLTGCNRDFAFISGLLHDIGRLVLASRYPEQYGEAVAYALSHDCPMLDAERAVLGLDHTIVGRVLAHQWKFPDMIQRAIANHHAPMQADLGGIPSVVHVANVLVHALDLAGSDAELVPPIAPDAWNSLRIDLAGLRQVFNDTESEFEEACQVLTA
jgi:putative nucleotidyltransferase with HDIG domain